MAFTKEDKKQIAEARGQYKYERDWTGELYFVGYRCRRCNKVFTRLSDFEVDHIKPRSKRGTDRPSNLQLLCKECNRKKSDKPWRKTTTVKTKTSTTKTKSSTVKKKPSTTKRKPRGVRRKTKTVNRKTRTVKSKSSTVGRKSSTVRRKRR